MIPKQAFFFWSAPNLSYLRYLCIRSLREQNPDLPITLYYVPCSAHERTWSGGIKQDFEGETPCYLNRLSDLNIEVSMGPDSTGHPIHSSDLFRYSRLYSNGGIYVDTDIFWTQPIDALYEKFSSFDNVISYSDRLGFQIGLLAGIPMSAFFYDLLGKAHSNLCNDAHYQACGVDALLGMLSDGLLEPPVRCEDALNKTWLSVLLERYPRTFILDGDLLYGIDGHDADSIFDGDDELSADSFVHLYGGSAAFQYYNRIIDEDSIRSIKGPIFNLIRSNLYDWQSSSRNAVL